MNSPLGALRADEITADDRRAVAEFCEANADSPVSIFLRRLMTVTDHGVDVTALSNDTELSPNEAAKLLKMSRPHLLTFMNRGLLPYTSVGTHRRIRVSDLLAFMDGREKGAAIVTEAVDTDKTAEAPLSGAEIADLEALDDVESMTAVPLKKATRSLTQGIKDHPPLHGGSLTQALDEVREERV